MSSGSKRSGRGMKPRPGPMKPVPTRRVVPAARPRVRPMPTAGGGVRRSRRNEPLIWLGVIGVVAVLVVSVLAVTVLRPAAGGTGGSTPSPARSLSASLAPPNATPLASPPSEPAGSGVSVTITTKLGKIVMQVFDQSAPVAATNFLNLVQAGFYNGITFHRLVPGFVIQGGDPDGNGGGGPGYSIQDEPVVGNYTRATVAMARTTAANSAGSQFFIVLDDAATSRFSRTYVIFGKVTAGMDVVDQIAAMPNAGGQTNAALNPVVMDSVTVSRP